MPLSVAESTNLIEIAPPILFHLDAQIKEHARAEQLLKVGTGLAADHLDGSASFADDNALLAVAFDVDGGIDCVEVRLALVFHFLHDHADSMRNLIAEAAQNLLAHEFGDDNLDRLVGLHVVREPLRAFRQLRGDRCHEPVDVFARLGGTALRTRPIRPARQRLTLALDLLVGCQVGF